MTAQWKNSDVSSYTDNSPCPETNILLVDDKPANLLVLEEVLKRKDYHLVKATSGTDALRFLLQEQFAVVLLDVQMPGMDGFETARIIRENARTRDIPVIFITAKSLTTEDIEKGYAENAVDYMLKPFNPDILRTKVSVFVELHRKTELLRQQAALLARKVEAEKEARNVLTQMTDNLKRSNTELEQFAYVVSHDLQEPLRMVESFMQLLAKQYKGKLDDTADQYINFAVDGAGRMRQMIKSILHYSRINSSAIAYEPVDCNKVVDTVIAALGGAMEDNPVHFTCDALPRVVGDETKLYQVFQNLIGNAIKFRREVPLKIHISNPTLNQIPEPPNPPDAIKKGYHLFRITDNGIGMDPESGERIFLIFQRLHGRETYPGTGIGLSICKKIIERHGGQIWMQSQPGKGSTFYFTLPGENQC